MPQHDSDPKLCPYCLSVDAVEYALLREIAAYAHNYLAQHNKRDHDALMRRVEKWRCGYVNEA